MAPTPSLSAQPADEEEPEFAHLDPPLSAISFDDIDAAVSASTVRERSPYSVGGHGLRAAVSPSKYCAPEARQMISARHQKAVASKATSTSLNEGAHSAQSTPEPGGTDAHRLTTPVSVTAGFPAPPSTHVPWHGSYPYPAYHGYSALFYPGYGYLPGMVPSVASPHR